MPTPIALRRLCATCALLFVLVAPMATAQPLDYTIQLDTVHQFWDGRYDWAQVCAGAIPGAGKDGGIAALITMQKEDNQSDDYYAGLNTLRSDDFGLTWQGPVAHKALTPHHLPDGKIRGLCDFVSGWVPGAKRFLITGHTVLYEKGRLTEAPYRRTTAYASYNPENDTWTPWQELHMPDAALFFNSGSGMCQWVLAADGTILLPVYFKPESEDHRECFSATVLRCAYDGQTLRYIEHGDVLRLDEPRGYCEPSLTFFQGRYYLTLRNDVRGYLATSTDGLHFDAPTPWTFDDGAELGSYNTQQHWATHSDGLYLVYTRRGADNDHVVRHRAPLFIAQVDPERRTVIRATERIAVPDRGASLGNFAVANMSEKETWITVGECMYKPEVVERGANGTVFAARLKWTLPNRLVNSVQPIPR